MRERVKCQSRRHCRCWQRRKMLIGGCPATNKNWPRKRRWNGLIWCFWVTQLLRATQGWEAEGRVFWDEYYGSLNALNLGFNGDRTEHVLWRLAHGAVEGIEPKCLVLLIGTNNTGHRQDAPQETALGIQAILAILRVKLPKTKILLLAIFPRSAKPTQKMRVLNDEVNRLMQAYADTEEVVYLDINECFLDDNGRVSPEVMGDYLHINAAQYRVWAEAIAPYILLSK